MNQKPSCLIDLYFLVSFVVFWFGADPAAAQSKTAGEPACATPVATQPAQPHPLPVLAAPATQQSRLWLQIPGVQAGDSTQTTASRNLRVSIVPGSRVQSSPAADAVQVPLADDTERAIDEVRQRLGTVGGSFSDLLSPAEQGKLFADALAKVRQENAAGPAPVPGQPGNPQQPTSPFGPQPPQHGQNQPGPYQQGPQAGPPHQGPGNLHWAPGQPIPPAMQPSFPHPGPGNSGAGPWPMNQPSPGMTRPVESETTAMRRIAREVDGLAEQLENIGRYSEADSLRRQAQQLRESVR